MGVEGRNLVHFGEREPHLLRQRGKMGGGQMSVVILNEVKMLDQEIAPARPVGQQSEDFLAGARIDLTPLGRTQRTAAPGPSAIPRRCFWRQFGQAHRLPLRPKKALWNRAK